MPDDRLLHARLGYSRKVNALDHLGYRVWTQYMLSADDFGVMAWSPAKVKGDNLALQRESEDAIDAALNAIAGMGLVVLFEHQGQTFACSECWQDYQKIRYPRASYLPIPPADILAKLSRKTRELFVKHSARKRGVGSTSGRANHRLTANGKRLTANAPEGESEGEAPADASRRPPTTKRKRAEKATEPDKQAVIAHYCDQFKARYGESPRIVARDAGALGQLITRYGAALVQARIDLWFSDADPFGVKSGHGVGAFVAAWNPLAALAARQEGREHGPPLSGLSPSGRATAQGAASYLKRHGFAVEGT